MEEREGGTDRAEPKQRWLTPEVWMSSAFLKRIIQHCLAPSWLLVCVRETDRDRDIGRERERFLTPLGL